MAIFGIFSTSRSFFTTNPFKRLLSFGGDDPPQTTGRTFSASFLSPSALLRRLWSFDSSDQPNELTMAASSHPSANDVENPNPQVVEIETAGSLTAADPEQDSKRVRKLVPSVSLAVATLCAGTYASIPAPVQQHPRSYPNYSILLAFVCLGVFTSLGLFMHSLVRPSGNEAVCIQKRLVVISILFFLIAFVLRISLQLPAASSVHVWLLFFFVNAVIALYLYTAWKKNSRNQTARDPDVPS